MVLIKRASPALELPGTHAFYTYHDPPHTMARARLGTDPSRRDTAGMGREDAESNGALTEEEREALGGMPIQDPGDDQDQDGDDE